MSVINTNVKSLVAQNAMAVNSRSLDKAMASLSTGSRINSASDDAAGLAISSKMTSQIRGLDQAVRNANDGISLLQATDGATVAMSDMLQRMRELAVNSSSDTNTSGDRSSMNLEYQQLTKQIKQIADNTQWNGMNIMNNNSNFGVGGTDAAPDTDGNQVRNVKIQVGANASQNIGVAFKDFSFGLGTTAAPTNGLVSFSGSGTMLGAQNFGIIIGATTFSASTAAGVAAAAPTDTETTAIAAALQTAIQNTVGFQAVTVKAVGNALQISDSQGRAMNTFTSTTVGNAVAGGPTTALAVTANASVAATAPAATAVFGGAAQINNTDVTTQSGANSAITALDNALGNVNTERAKLGATINRLTYAADNLANVSQNTSASRSRILDTDYAKATTELSRTQIIAQASTAMLAQANQSAQSVLALLK